MLFKWRRHYRRGLLDQPGKAVALLPVSVAPSPAPTAASAAQPAETVPEADSAAIEIVFKDCTVRVEGAADMRTLRAALALLRQ